MEVNLSAVDYTKLSKHGEWRRSDTGPQRKRWFVVEQELVCYYVLRVQFERHYALEEISASQICYPRFVGFFFKYKTNTTLSLTAQLFNSSLKYGCFCVCEWIRCMKLDYIYIYYRWFVNKALMRILFQPTLYLCRYFTNRLCLFVLS